MFKKLLTKLRSEKGDAVLVTAILSTPLFMIAFGLAADTAKNIYVSSSYSSAAQAAVETAVKDINARGSLTNDSVRSLVKEFKVQNADSIYHTKEANAFESELCSTAEINGVNRKLPYYEVTLGTARTGSSAGHTSVWKVDGSGKVTDKILSKNTKYRVISADVYTSSQNIILGTFGQPCQLIKSSVSAIAFGDNVDLKEELAPPKPPVATALAKPVELPSKK